MKDIKKITEVLNEFRTAFQNFNTDTFQQYAKVYGIPYKGQILTLLVREQVVTRTKPGSYQWIDKPVHYLKVQSIIGECKEIVNKSLKNTKQVQPVPTAWPVEDIINSLTNLEIEAEAPTKIKELDIQESMQILKILGYKLFKQVTVRQEIK